MRDTGPFMRTVATVTAMTFSMLILTPTAIAARTEIQKAAQQTDINVETELSQTFANITEKLDQLEQAREAGNDQAINDTIATLQELQSDVPALDEKAMAHFNKLEQDLIKKKLPETILQRHRDMVTHYKAHRNALNKKLDNIDQGQWRWQLEKWLDAAQTFITGEKPIDAVDSPYKNINPKKFKRSQQDFDPNNLPNKSLRPDKNNKPKVKKEAFKQAALFNTPANQLAALGDFSYDALAGANDPAYLAQTDEVLLTQPIIDQAAVLNHDPVKIYHWVRNNIEWQPTWGAIQDAELTLDARRGNAMDIASLTIALLRASQIPARYVHGTINVPIEQFNNWAGGFTNSDAAVDFAASGGIPTGAGTSGGKITETQLEHIWVEAAIDYFPSRGAINRDADSWVQMDPSYKQYEYLEGLDVLAVTGIDANLLKQEYLDSGTINENESWMSGLDSTVLEQASQQSIAPMEEYIANNFTEATIEDVIGGSRTIIQEYPALPSSLPNRIIVEGARYDKLPTQLQQQVTYTLGRDELGQPLNPTTFAYSTLNNEKVTLSFKPATANDEAALLALLPEGEITDFSQLPESIPSYLINVIPEFKINGELRMSGLPMRLGEDLIFNTKIKFPSRSRSENYDYKVIAGSYLSVNVVAGNVSENKIESIQMKVAASKSIVENNDVFQVASLTREDVYGDVFHMGMLSYFNQLLSYSHTMGLKNRAHFNLSSGYGTFGYEPKVNYLFGFPIDIKSGGIVLDIPMTVVTSTNSGNNENKIKYLGQVGVFSSILEHTIPSFIFNTKAINPSETISAIKALRLAMQQGQRIYAVTNSNIAETLTNINLNASTKAEIIASVNAGLEVITHTDDIVISGYTGAGYIIIDPETGNGAYKISGGLNGGERPDIKMKPISIISEAHAGTGSQVLIEIDPTDCLEEKSSFPLVQILAIAAAIALLIRLAAVAAVPIAAAAITMIYSSAATAGEENPCNDNCILNESRVNETHSWIPVGCIWCFYRCKNSTPPNTPITRFNYIEEGCPSPVSWVAGSQDPAFCSR